MLNWRLFYRSVIHTVNHALHTTTSLKKNISIAPEAKIMALQSTDEYEPFSLLVEEKSVIIAKLSEFHNDSIHCPGREAVLMDYSVSNDFFGFHLTIYANGSNDDNKGWISLVFEGGDCRNYLAHLCKNFEFSFVVGVIDTSGNKRFLRSFVYDINSVIYVKMTYSLRFRIEQYVERESLLAKPFDYLPEDCVTLHTEVSFKTIPSKITEHDRFLSLSVNTSFELEDSGEKYFLLLYSKVGETLRKESAFFRSISDTPMREGRTRRMSLPDSEYRTLARIGRILMGESIIFVNTVFEICEMYVLADKYLIPVVIEICRSLVFGFLRELSHPVAVESVPGRMLLELAEKHEDTRLKEIVERFSKRDEANVEDKYATGEDIEFETGWKVEPVRLRSSTQFRLLKCVRQHKRQPEYDFYH